MKKLIFIALMFSFLMGNAQQDGQQFGPNNAWEQDQYLDNHPGLPILSDLNRDQISKTDDAGLPILIDLNKNKIRKTDNLGLPILKDLNRNRIGIPDNLGLPVHKDLNRYTIKKPY